MDIRTIARQRIALVLAATLAMPMAANAADTAPTVDAASPAPAATSAVVASRERAADARQAFDDFLRAYERGDLAMLQRHLDASMIGYGQFLDGVQADSARQRQTRIALRDVQVMAGPDVAVIQARWQKRFLAAATFQPALQEGAGMFMLHRGVDGWRLAAIAGDTPFAGGGGVLAQVVFQPALLACPPAAACPVTLEVRDPDVAGNGSVSLVMTTSIGDRETLVLNETSPGRFLLTTLSINPSTPVTGNGLLEAGSGTVFTATYTDATAGPGRPATPVSAKARLP